jgi:nucleoside-diphosphate-sugar epimerase
MNGIVGTRVRATYGPPRAGDVRDSQADIAKAQRLLDYEPRVGLEEGLKHTIAWCRATTINAKPAKSAKALVERIPLRALRA